MAKRQNRAWPLEGQTHFFNDLLTEADYVHIHVADKADPHFHRPSWEKACPSRRHGMPAGKEESSAHCGGRRRRWRRSVDFPYTSLHPVEISPCGANLEAVFSQNRSKMGIWPNLAHICDFQDSRGGESKTMRVAEIGRATR